MNEVAKHYDILIDEGQDPVHDPKPLQEYMDKWDGRTFVDKMQLDKTKSVLEIGVGTGRLAVRTAPYCKRFTGIDISAKTISKAKENVKNANLICGDFLAYDFDATYDCIYSSLTFLHIKEKQKAFCMVAELLNKNGRFVLSIDKNQEEVLDIGSSKIRIYPDNPSDIKEYAKNCGLTLVEQTETEFAHIFVFIKNYKQ